MALSLFITGISICTDQADPIRLYFLGRTSIFIKSHFPPIDNSSVQESDTDITILPTWRCLIFAHLIVHIMGGQLVSKLCNLNKIKNN
ncbi:hypothetical protein BDF21DRAFT_418814 [Thamnidium elegans]|nr:hypothetical protein BDF21DRAFT_418814 [Thamnidium elegans]